MVDEERQVITCGCGFSVTGSDPDANQEAYEEHNCPLIPTKTQNTLDVLIDNLFSFWGWLVVLTIGAVVYAVLTGKWVF